MADVSILGAGSFGVALSVLLTNNGHKVTLRCSDGQKAEKLGRERQLDTLPGVRLPDSVRVTGDIREACEGKDIIILAAASVYIRELARSMAPYVPEGQIVVSAAKGIEEDTLKTLSEQIEEELPRVKIAVLSGPSHAEEVGRGLPTTCVVGSAEEAVAETVRGIFMSEVFRVYTNPDVKGIELAGALKNVIALAAGMVDGLGYGDNAKAALITRGLAELTRLASAMGCREETMYGLAGIGDLVVTCASMHSRNRRAGILIGQGAAVEEAMSEVNMVVEGVYSARAGLTLARRYGVEMPIVESVNEVLFDGKSPAACMKELMLRDPRREHNQLKWE